MPPSSEQRILLPRRPERIGVGDLMYLAIAVGELLLARARHARLPIGDILHGLRGPATDVGGSTLEEADVAQVGWAIGAAARRMPWRADCLLQAMAADRWLRRLGAAPELTIGVERDETGGLRAHAWLRCNGVAVTGGSDDSFAPLLEPQSGSNEAPRSRQAATPASARDGIGRRQA